MGALAPAMKGPTGVVLTGEGRARGGQGPRRLREGERPEADREGRLVEGKPVEASYGQAPGASCPAVSSALASSSATSTACSMMFVVALDARRRSSAIQRQRPRRLPDLRPGPWIDTEKYTWPHYAEQGRDPRRDRRHDRRRAGRADRSVQDEVQRHHRGGRGRRPAARRAAAPAVEEQTEFTVVLKGGGAQEDPGHQGRPRDHQPRPQGSQGPGRRRADGP